MDPCIFIKTPCWSTDWWPRGLLVMWKEMNWLASMGREAVTASCGTSPASWCLMAWLGGFPLDALVCPYKLAPVQNGIYWNCSLIPWLYKYGPFLAMNWWQALVSFTSWSSWSTVLSENTYLGLMYATFTQDSEWKRSQITSLHPHLLVVFAQISPQPLSPLVEILMVYSTVYCILSH